MEAAAFESLAQKVELAVTRIEGLKQELAARDAELEAVRGQLSEATGRAEGLEQELAGKNQEIEALKGDLSQRSENLTEAGNRVRELVTRLEAALV